MGLGIEGVALSAFLVNKCESVTLLDQKEEDDLRKNQDLPGISEILDNPTFSKIFGKEYLFNLKRFDVIFRSPGIPYLSPEIQEAKANGVEISSQIKLFFELCPASIIGVTGTKGKGTTASLIYDILKKKTPKESLWDQKSGNINKVFFAGNIGHPAISLIDEISEVDTAILELSSFQLQDLNLSPHIAVITNISIDHLDYHKDENEYHEAKESIVKFQNKNDFAVINQDYLTSFEFASLTSGKTYYFSGENSVDEGAFIRKLQNPNAKLRTKEDQNDVYEVVLRIDDKEEIICGSDEIKLVGRHNLENVAAASITSMLAGASIDEIRDGVKNFDPLPHRLEFVREINGVKIYNDSFATNPDPTMAAINSFSSEKILILGGSSKGANFDELAEKIVHGNVAGVVLIGDEAKKIKNSLEKYNFPGEIVCANHDFKKAIFESLRIAKPGSIIIFSPACASFDMFKNYKDRGNKFKEMIAQAK